MTFSPGMKRLGVSLFFCVCLMGSAFAEMVEVAPGVKITKRTFTGPITEQPFLGLVEFPAWQRELNEKFAKDSIAFFGSREKAFDAAIQIGREALREGKGAIACQRFNQAYMIDPTPSVLYQMFALLASEWLKDNDFAEELYKIARTQPNPRPNLNTDYGTFLISAERLREAVPVLEQATLDDPNSNVAWISLATARILVGNRHGACAAAETVKQRRPTEKIQAQIKRISDRAKCGEIASTPIPVEVAPGVKVTKKAFEAQQNEQPFYGFIPITARQRDANEKFVKAVLEATGGNREKAVDELIKRGWSLIKEDKLGEATRRFNQAFLVEPRQSSIYHSLAVVVADRFQDSAYADELFRVARTLPNPMISLNADHGRLLLKMGRVQEALPFLEQAVIDMPTWDSGWLNLGLARFRKGDHEGACAAARKTKELPSRASNVEADLAQLISRAKCEVQ